MSNKEITEQPDISEILNEEISATTRLLETLEAERKSVIAADTVALENAVHDKEQALVQLNRLEQQRISRLSSAGYSADPDGMMAYIDQRQMTGLWSQLLLQAGKCRDQNRENHQLVDLYSQHTHRALCILRGEDPAQEVYGPAGITRDRHERRSLAKA